MTHVLVSHQLGVMLAGAIAGIALADTLRAWVVR